MFFVGLVHARDWEPPEELPEPPPRRHWDVPWRPILVVAAWWLMLAYLPPVVSDALGGFAGYVALLAVVGIGFWRLERWCATQYWRGLRDFKS
jgi:hypothetical protein